MSNFADVLGSIEGGILFNQLNEQLQDLVVAVTDHRKAGEITLTLKILPNGDRAVSVTGAIKSKVPEAAKGMTIFYADGGGNLLRRDPRQQELALREVDEPARTLKQA
jgi:hypothetical protein